MRALEQYIEEVRGKKYHINPRKILARFNKLMQKDEDGYFCSELIAEAY